MKEFGKKLFYVGVGAVGTLLTCLGVSKYKEHKQNNIQISDEETENVETYNEEE